MESSAAEAIAGLTVTSANYEEAIATLKKRFGNPQLIVDRHMESLLRKSAVLSPFDIKGLRKLHYSVEAHIRGLHALAATAYCRILKGRMWRRMASLLLLITSVTASIHQALAGDIEKAFLMLSMDKQERESLQFLWVEDPQVEPAKVIETFRFYLTCNV